MAARLTRGCLVVAVVGLAAVTGARGQDDPRPIGQEIVQKLGTAGQDLGQVQSGLIRWAEINEPGLGQDYLACFVGSWDCEMKIWLDPTKDPLVSTGTAEMTMELGGRVLTQRYSGMMNGQPFEGLGHQGYDNVRNLFWSTWIDSLSTNMGTMRGSLDASGSIMTLIGEMDEPMLGQYGKSYMTRVRVESPDRHVFQVMEILYGEPFPAVEITYERK